LLTFGLRVSILEGSAPSTRPAFGVAIVRPQAPKRSELPPRCHDPASHQKYATTSSTSCTTNPMRSECAASSQNRGFHAPKNTFSVKSPSILFASGRPGEILSRILSTRLRITPVTCSSLAKGSHLLRPSGRVLGLSRFLMSCA
jgi:hypothetical protein